MAPARNGEQIEPELQRILAGGVRQLVDERLIDPGDGVAARRAQRAGRHAERLVRRRGSRSSARSRREIRSAGMFADAAKRSPSP